MIRIVFALLVLVLLAGPALAQRNSFDLSRTRGLVHAHFLPAIDDTYDLGSATFEWRNLYIDGIGNIDTLRCDDLESSGGTDWAAVSGADVAFQGAGSFAGLLSPLASVDVTGHVTASTYGGFDRVAVGCSESGLGSGDIGFAGTLVAAAVAGNYLLTHTSGNTGIRADSYDRTSIVDGGITYARFGNGVCAMHYPVNSYAELYLNYGGVGAQSSIYAAGAGGNQTLAIRACRSNGMFSSPYDSWAFLGSATGAGGAGALMMRLTTSICMLPKALDVVGVATFADVVNCHGALQVLSINRLGAGDLDIIFDANQALSIEDLGSVPAIAVTTTGNTAGRSAVITATRVLLGVQHIGTLTYGGTLGGGNEWGFSGDLVVDGDLYPSEDLHLATGKSIQWNSLDALTGDATGALTAEVSLDVTGVTTLGEGAVLGRLTSAPSGHVTSSAHLYLRRETNDSRTVVGFEGTVDGRLNFATGYQAQHALTTGHSNHATGYQAQYALTTGNSNHATGYQAQYALTTGYSNHATGNYAQYSLTTGNSNHVTGNYAQYSLTTGSSNHATGYYAQYALTTGYSNLATGYYAQYALTTGNSNHATGYQAQYALTTGYSNLATGYQAQYALTTGYSNHATGNYAQYSLTTGSSNHATGYQAQYYLTTGSSNASLGTSAAAGLASYASDDVIALGSYSVWKIPDGISNVVAMGKFSGVVPVSDNAYFGGYDPDTTTQYPLHLNYEVPAADISGATLNVAINRTDYYIPVSTTAGVLDASANPFKPKIYSQNDEPDIPNDTEAIWSDSDAGPIVYKLVDIGGTQYKRALDS